MVSIADPCCTHDERDACAGQLRHVRVAGVSVAYRQAGSGTPVLLLHGWPTSSYLWRSVIPRSPLLVAAPLRRIYPASVLPAPRELRTLRMLLALLRLSGLGPLFVRAEALKLVLRLGVVRGGVLTPEVVDAYRAPFVARKDRQVLLRTLLAPRFDEFEEIGAGLQRLAGKPTLIAWADHDLLLPRSEMRRLLHAFPSAETATVEHAGHFLQEDQPEQVARLIASFLHPEKEDPR